MAATPKVLVLCDGDPGADGLFSGAARFLTTALEKRGLIVGKGNVSARGFWDGRNVLTRAARKLDSFHWEARARWSDAAFARKTAAAEALVAAHPDANALLMFGTTFQPHSNLPSYCYLDATVKQVRDARAWEFAHFDDAYADRVQAYQRAIFERCACVFTFSEWAAASVRDDYGIESARVMAVGGGSNFTESPENHGSYDQKRILFVGKDFERKGGPLVVDAFRRVRAAIPDATLVIAGCEPPIDVPGVEVVGFLGKDSSAGEHKLLALYRDASVLCLMSSFEPFGLVIIEAGLSGVPCVTPDRFAFPETVVDGETGRRLQTYDADKLAHALVGLLSDPNQLAEMGKSARAHMRGRFEWDAVAERIVSRIALGLGGAS